MRVSSLVWLADDHIAWTETAGESSVLMLAKVGEAGRPIRAWKNAHLGLLPAPGGRAIVADMRVREGSGSRSAAGDMGDDTVAAIETGVEFTAVPSKAVYLLDKDRWVGAEHIWEIPRDGKAILRWAGPRTFLRTGFDAPTELVSIDRPREVVRLWSEASPV